MAAKIMQNNICAANVSGLLPIIRVPAITEYYISQALDIGALGVQVPKVQTKEDARKAVEYAKFYPQVLFAISRQIKILLKVNPFFCPIVSGKYSKILLV